MEKDYYIERLLTAISHPNRIKILRLLKEEKTLCGCEILSAIGIEQSNLSRHLNTLVQAGVIYAWKEGTRMNYKISDKRIFDILDIAEQIVNKKLSNLKVLV
ncbi:ArsR/SmtB family transcription factor [Rosettibacter firmus]|uniref:ArsR/SmtB family transcription factor n=1 Tax=Rosettibacter firmus TaxID=3111522 RepID=UPI00336BEB19